MQTPPWEQPAASGQQQIVTDDTGIVVLCLSTYKFTIYFPFTSVDSYMQLKTPSEADLEDLKGATFLFR